AIIIKGLRVERIGFESREFAVEALEPGEFGIDRSAPEVGQFAIVFVQAQRGACRGTPGEVAREEFVGEFRKIAVSGSRNFALRDFSAACSHNDQRGQELFHTSVATSGNGVSLCMAPVSGLKTGLGPWRRCGPAG